MMADIAACARRVIIGSTTSKTPDSLPLMLIIAKVGSMGRKKEKDYRPKRLQLVKQWGTHIRQIKSTKRFKKVVTLMISAKQQSET